MLFKKKKPTEDIRNNGRHRPDAAANRPANPQAFSYYSKRSDEQNNTGRREAAAATDIPSVRLSILPIARSGRRLRNIALATLSVLTIGYLSLLSTSPQVVLRQNTATQYFLQDKTVYQQSAERLLKDSILNKNKLTADTAAVSVGLLKSYPELKSATVNVSIIAKRPTVYIEPFQPSFVLTTVDSNAFLLDATGRALATTSQISNIDAIDVPTLQDKTGITVTTGRRALPSTTIQYAQTVLAVLKSAGMTASAIVLPASAYELDVYISGVPYYIKFNLQEDALEQSGTYLAAQERLVKDKVKAGEYIDVRVPGRAYYR